MSPPMLTRRAALLMTLAGVTAAGTPKALAGERRAGSWQTGPALPFAVQEIYPCRHDGKLHLAGGFIAENGEITGPTSAHHALDPATGLWTPRAPLPVARHHPQLVSLGGRLHCLGGFEADERGAWQMQGDMWVYKEAGDNWEWAPELPVPNAESVAGVIRGDLYLASGRLPKGDRNLDWTDHVDTARAWCFSRGQWEEVAPMPSARNSATGGALDGRLHVVGGRTVSGGNTAVHEAYDPWSDRWERLAPMPKAQGGLASAVIGDKLYVFGGEYLEGAGGVFPDAWVYDARRDSWSALPDMPSPRHGLGAVAQKGDIYVIGGARQAGGHQTSAAVEIYTP